jgi:hypothetical protein
MAIESSRTARRGEQKQSKQLGFIGKAPQRAKGNKESKGNMESRRTGRLRLVAARRRLLEGQLEARSAG